MKRRDFVAILATTSLGASGQALAQASGKIPRVGVLVSAAPPHPFADAFMRGLRTLGYAEGQNIAVEFRYTEGRSDRAEELAAELVRFGVDVIVAHFTPAVRTAMGATRTIPIVMAPAGAPLQTGFVKSLARPGGNVTGLSAMDAEIGGKRLQLLRELIPTISRFAVLASTPTTDPYSGPFVEDLRAAATKAGLQIEPILIGGPSELRTAFAAMVKAEAQAVIVQPLFDPHRTILLELAARYRLPYMSGSRDTTAAGGLVSISANFVVLYEWAATYVHRILKGAVPTDLPVEQPTKFQVVINIKTAQSLGLTIPPSVLAQVDEIIE